MPRVAALRARLLAESDHLEPFPEIRKSKSISIRAHPITGGRTAGAALGLPNTHATCPRRALLPAKQNMQRALPFHYFFHVLFFPLGPPRETRKEKNVAERCQIRVMLPSFCYNSLPAFLWEPVRHGEPRDPMTQPGRAGELVLPLALVVLLGVARRGVVWRARP